MLGAWTAATAVFLGAAGTSAAAVDCTPRPATPNGYWLSAVKADRVGVPASAPSIAVLDTGIANVPELSGRLEPGYNVVSGDRNTNDIDGHGTAVATIAAGAAGGTRGVSPTSPVIPIKVFDDRGEATPEDFIAGIERAVAARASVINISGEGLASAVDRATAREVRNAIYSAVSLGIPVVAPSGNEDASSLAVPAAYPHVLAVGATDESGARAPFSNLGSGLDLVAPGSAVVTAAPGVLCSTGYGTFTGTSFAAPIVAGGAALLLQRHPDLEVSQIADMLRLRGARAAAPAWSPEIGFGMLDVAAALDAPVPSPDLPEVNDDIAWAKLQPVVFGAPRRARTLFARIAPHMDPADVYRVKLRKRDRLRVRLQAAPGARLKLAFGARKLASRAGSSFTQRIRTTGTYYVGVSIAKSPPAGSGYALSLKR
jgi:subtilisin family serine protease